MPCFRCPTFDPARLQIRNFDLVCPPIRSDKDVEGPIPLPTTRVQTASAMALCRDACAISPATPTPAPTRSLMMDL